MQKQLEREPAAGQRWRHYKGGLYEVVCVGLYEVDMQQMVAYRRIGVDQTVWFRLMTNWLSTMDENGYLPRFTRVS